MDANERLKQVLDALNLNQKNFADSIGTTQATLSRQLKGLHKIDMQAALAVQAVHGVSASWLLSGEGEMFLSFPVNGKKYGTPEKIPWDNKGNSKILSGITDFEQINRTQWFMNLSKEQKKIISDLSIIKNADFLKTISKIITSQAAKEKSDCDLLELEKSLKRKKKK